MEKRVRIFEGCSGSLEGQINEFLSDTPGKLVDIKYGDGGGEWPPSVLIIFIPEGENGEKGKSTKKNEKGNDRVQGKIVAFREQIGPDSYESGSGHCHRHVGSEESVG